MERDLYAMRQGRQVSGKPLGACKITGQHNPTAVWLTEAGLKHRVNFHEELSREYPKCWLLDIEDDRRVE